MTNQKVDLCLSNISNGKLEQDFSRAYQELLSSLHEGEKGSITITVNLERIKDTTTMVKISCEMKSKKPGIKTSSIAQIVDNTDGLKLITEMAPQNMVIFNKTKGAN